MDSTQCRIIVCNAARILYVYTAEGGGGLCIRNLPSANTKGRNAVGVDLAPCAPPAPAGAAGRRGPCLLSTAARAVYQAAMCPAVHTLIGHSVVQYSSLECVLSSTYKKNVLRCAVPKTALPAAVLNSGELACCCIHKLRRLGAANPAADLGPGPAESVA